MRVPVFIAVPIWALAVAICLMWAAFLILAASIRLFLEAVLR